MAWSLPNKGLEWKLRYNPESLTKGEYLSIASILSAYGQIIFDPKDKRQSVVGAIRKELRRYQEDA